MYSEGDLLLALLRLEMSDWKNNPNELKRFIMIIKGNRSQIENCREISNELIEKYV